MPSPAPRSQRKVQRLLLSNWKPPKRASGKSGRPDLNPRPLGPSLTKSNYTSRRVPCVPDLSKALAEASPGFTPRMAELDKLPG